MQRTFRILLEERFIFLLIVFGQLIPFWLITFVPTMDGPQHLHNSQVLMQLLQGNEAMKEFYIVNPVIVGYWTGPFLLTFFNFLLPAHIAESLLISVYLVGLAYAFRYLVKSINPEPSHLTLLIIPFSYTFFFLLGYYAFSLAFIFFFLSLGYYLRNKNHLDLKKSFILFLLISGIFLSHAFVFAWFGLTLVLLVLMEFINDLYSEKTKKGAFQKLFRKSIRLLIISLPAIVLFVVYISNVMGIDSTVESEKYNFHERINFLVNIRAIIGYNMEAEAWSNYIYWLIIVVGINYFLHRSFVRMKLKGTSRKEVFKELFSDKYIWPFIVVIFLIIYLSIPDRISVGSLVNRIAVFLFYFLILWAASVKLPKNLSLALAALLVVAFIYQASYRTKVHKDLARYTRDVHTIEKHIEPNSIVYPVRVSSHWIDLHFLNYLGVGKPIINLGNPQSGGQFPVVWNYERIPKLMVGNMDVTNQYARDHSRSKNQEVVNVEYVAVYRWGEFQASEGHTEIKDQLAQFYEMVKLSPAQHVALFRLKD